MKAGYGICVITILCIGVILQANSSSVASTTLSQDIGLQSNVLRHCTLHDSAPAFAEPKGYTPPPEHPPLHIHASTDPSFDYMVHSPYYKAFLKETKFKIMVKNTWIEFEVTPPEEIKNVDSSIDANVFSIYEMCESIDLTYELDTSVVTEEFTLKEQKDFSRIIYDISWEGVTPHYEEDNSIVFCDKNEEKILKILPPFMKDAAGTVCKDIHYEIIETESGYELHKVIDEPGLYWLKKAVYPVIIDPSIETFEDAWESSGLQPYGQYFKNLKEYTNPANGHLTISHTDLTIPGRGIDLEISRIYETPAVFYGLTPYDYEAPLVNVGKGWRLDFPYIGEKYVHLQGNTTFKIVWDGTQFYNRRGGNFILDKNGDNTYTLTTADGLVYEFSTSGKITEIKDLDQNSITFSYIDGVLTSITDTIGRTVTLKYFDNKLWKIVYNNEEIEFSYDDNGCLQWSEDFLNRRTSYSYDTEYNNWLLSKIVYATSGYTTYQYDRYSDSGYYRYHVTNQKVYDVNQVRHTAYSYTGTFSEISGSETAVKDGSDITQGYFNITLDNGLITQKVIKNASGTPIRKYTYSYDSNYDTLQKSVYVDGSTLSYTEYYTYDNWGNIIYMKDAQGHEQFFSYANTSTSGYFIDNTGTIVKEFTNAFSNCTVHSSVHTALLGMAEKQDATYVKEVYYTYDLNGHVTDTETLFGESTAWLTYSGTFNEYTSDTSFSIDLTGHTVTGNGVLKVTGKPSTPTYQESHSYTPDYQCTNEQSTWNCYGWVGGYYRVDYVYCCGKWPEHIDCYGPEIVSIGYFTHRPGSLGYQSYSTTPACDQKAYTFTVTTNWKAYPAQVKYNINGSDWTTISENLKDTTPKITVPGLTNGQNTLYFTESSSKKTKFSWELYVPVDNSPDSYTTSMQYDTYGNITSITDAELNTVTFNYSSNYSYAYLTEISAPIGTDTKTTKATYDYYRGWITSVQEPKGVASSGYDTVYTYDVLGRIIKKEFPLLDGQSERSYLEAVYDCENRTTTLIDQLGHYIVQEYDRLGRNTSTKWYTGQYGSGTLYATTLYTYRYDNLLTSVTDPGNYTTTYTYDFLGRKTQISYPASSVLYAYNDTDKTVTYTDGRGFDTVYWYDAVNQLIKVEEEYESGSFAQTVYQYNEAGHLITMTDAENNATTFEYGSLFGVTKKVYPDSTSEEYQYDNAGNITHFTDAKENTTTYTYDSIYRLTQIQYQDGSTVSFAYDLNDNRVTMEDNAPGTGDYTACVYDNWDRVTSKTRHISQESYTVSYQYDEANRVTKLTYPDDMQIVYSYDDLNRMTEIKRYIDGGNDEIVLNNVQYDTRNFLTQAEYGNGLTATFSYDSLGRVLTLDIKDGQTSYLDLDYMYDNNSNITQLVNGWRDTNLNWHSDTESYSYDGLNRVTSADCTSWSHTYSYDKVGNRITKDSVTYTINTVNEVTDLNDGTSFVYDLNGNRIQKTKGTDTWDYTYDYVNRLIKIEENSSVTGEYVYDGDGNRLQKIENGETTTYIRRGTQVLYEENSNGSATYIYGPTGRIAKRTAINQEKNAFYYHKDHLDSTRLVTDSSKNIVAAIRYHPFGDIDIKEGSESYLYTGQEKDSGLYYYGARYYDCNVGRFITRDVYTWLPDDPRSGNTRENAKWLENPQKFNRFSYAQNNPVKYNDPTGFCCEMGNSRYREKVNMIETGRVSGIHRNFPIRMDLRRLGMMINPQENFRLRLNWGFRPLGGGRTCYVIVTDCNGEEQRTFKYKEGNEKERKEAMDKTIALIGFYRSSKCPLEYDVKCYTKDEDPHLDEICAGTFFICIFFALGILIVFVRYERKKPR